jgi:NADH-quinone oxidoreductase subunit L
MLYVLIVFLPAIAALIAGFFGRWIGDRGAQLVTCVAVTVSALLSIAAFYEVGFGAAAQHVELLTWIRSGSFELSWALQIDTLTCVMLVVVTVVSALVHWYSVGYMDHDPHKPRFMAFLSLFTFAMLMLVTADNFVQLFFGWEGVGLASYLLIGFWYDRPSANAAAIKAFIVNRVGDFGFALGIMGVFLVFNSVDYATVFEAAAGKAGQTFSFLGMDLDIMTTLTMLLFVGAMGKSAQLFLHTWLPDAMEGPTPVSALIHAATMVTAGVFMVARLSPMFEYAPTTLAVVTVVGAATAFFAASVALVQNDIKRVIAYSTCSQLGYMFFAAGLSAYSAAIFHLFTHAFFKALLFLGSGSVIHGMSGEQDMRRMGGLYTLLPLTYALMWIGSLSLAGIVPLSGYWSKDLILEAAFAAGPGIGYFAYWVGVTVAFMTAFYSGRLLFMTFHGPARADKAVMSHVHEAPKVMNVPNLLLAVGAIVAGWWAHDFMVGDTRNEFWGSALFVMASHDPLEHVHHLSWMAVWLPMVAALAGLLLSWFLYVRRPELPATWATVNAPLYRFLLNKWYFDELYDVVFVNPAKWLGRVLWKGGDGRVIDGFGPDGFAALVVSLARRAVTVQSGYVYHYAFAMLIGVAGLVTYLLVVS